jgi:hypothetical protein
MFKKAIPLSSLLILFSIPSFTQDYRFIKIDPPPEVQGLPTQLRATFSVFSINNKGKILADYQPVLFDPSNDATRRLVFLVGQLTTSGKVEFRELKFRGLSDDAIVEAVNINDKGLIGGFIIHFTTRTSRGFVRLKSGLVKEYDVVSTDDTVGGAINNLLHRVGFTIPRDENDFTRSSFLINESGTHFLNYPGLSESDTFAHAINDNDQVVGLFGDRASLEDGFSRAFVYDGKGNTYYEIIFPGSGSNVLYGINNHGDVVGFCGPGDREHFFRERSYVYENGAFTEIAVPVSLNPGANVTETSAFSINDDGIIVGKYFADPSTPNSQEFGFAAIPIK